MTNRRSITENRKWNGFENLQTVFDDTKVLDGAPGKNITMARRKGQNGSWGR